MTQPRPQYQLHQISRNVCSSIVQNVDRGLARSVRTIWLLLVLILIGSDLSAQEGEGNLIFFDALPFADTATGGGRIDLYAAVPYRALDFSKGADGFSARYRVTMTLTRDGETIFDSTWTRNPKTNDYAKVEGRTTSFEFFQQRLDVPPGEYTARFELLDFGTNMISRARRNLTVIRFPNYTFALSGLMLVSKIREKESGYSITPLLTSNISQVQDQYFLFFEAYNRTGLDSFLIRANYRNQDDEIVWQDLWEKRMGEGRSQQWVRLPVNGFDRGEYIVEIAAFGMNEPEDTLAVSKRQVQVLGTGEGMPLSEAELMENVKKLRYAANQSEIEFIETAETFTEKRRRYAEFWNRYDPTPGTPKNEAMEEYFRRIDHANKSFRSYAEGWLTDMGRIYIVFGPPDRVDRDPFASDGRPKETWEYYSRRLSLVFVDQTGFGDFRLTTPVSLSEKFRY